MNRSNWFAGHLSETQVRILLALATLTMFVLSAGAPGRFRTIADTGNHVYQLPIKDEIVSATIHKQDNSGRKLTVEIYNEGKLIKSGSVTAPGGTVNINVDMRTT